MKHFRVYNVLFDRWISNAHTIYRVDLEIPFTSVNTYCSIETPHISCYTYISEGLRIPL